jgi:hypothetical protein
MLSVPLGGLAVQRSGRPDAAIAGFSLAGGIALALLSAGVAPLAMGIAFALAMGPPAGAIMALPARVLSPGHRAGGLGVFLTFYYVMLAFGPALAGALRAWWGSAAAAMLLAAVLMTGIAILLALFALLAARTRLHGAALP